MRMSWVRLQEELDQWFKRQGQVDLKNYNDFQNYANKFVAIAQKGNSNDVLCFINIKYNHHRMLITHGRDIQ